MMHDATREVIEHAPRARNVGGVAAGQRKQLPFAHGRNRTQHGGVDQACALGGNQGRQLAMGHRLQGAHLDEELAGCVTGQESVRTGKDAAHALVLGNDGENHVDRRRDLPRIGRCLHAIALSGERLGVLVPGDHLAAAFGKPLRNRRAHASEADQTDFHVGCTLFDARSTQRVNTRAAWMARASPLPACGERSIFERSEKIG